MFQAACRTATVMIALSTLLATAGATPVDAPEGQVRFYQLAKSNFDDYTDNPTPAQQQWMREHYFRLQAWSPYFDDRLSWFADTWVYKDSYAIKPDWDIFTDHPEWVLKDAAGNRLYIPYNCSGGTCPQFAGDFGNPAFRDWWISGAQDLVSRGYIGIWIDDVNLEWRVSNGNGNHVTPIDPRTGVAMTLDDWQRYFAEFMEAVRGALPDTEIGHNALWFAAGEDYDNPHAARQIDAADYFNLERGATDGGLTDGDGRYGFQTWLGFIDFVHSRGRNVILMDEADTTAQREFALAAWFLISDGGDWMSTEHVEWTTPDGWWPGYELDLADALTGRYAWQGLIRRDFECGSVFLNQPDLATVSATLPESMTRIDGTAVTAISLDGGEATVLTRNCDPDPPPASPTDLVAD